MLISSSQRVLINEDERALYVNNLGAVILKIAPGLPGDTRVDQSQDRKGQSVLEKGLNLHPEMVRFLARDDVHEALKRAVHAEEFGWQEPLKV